jgi:retron-type reverse transcriptase
MQRGDHGLLEAMLREKITDERFLRYMKRMFQAGVLTAGELTVSEVGVPQGSCCSPVLANSFAHHVLDTWFEEVVKPHCRGQVALYRYADDAVKGTPLHPLDHVLCQTAGAYPLLRGVLQSGTRAAVPAQGDPDTVEMVKPP